MNNKQTYKNIKPKIAPTAFVHSHACVIGNVAIGQKTSIWPMASLRGDVNPIKIGNRTNIQDNCTLHTTGNYPENNFKGFPLTIGNDVTVGHQCILHGCTLEDETFIGMGSIILDGAIIKKGAMLGAKTLVTQNKILESGFLYMGTPVQKIRPLTNKEQEFIMISAQNYKNLMLDYKKYEKK